MTDQLPSVSQALNDSEGLAKRIRRPALSCVECRMRKVKCDRNKPCGACIRTKSEKCTYRPARAATRRTEQLPEAAGSTTALDRSGPIGEHQAPEPTSMPSERSASDLSSHSAARASSFMTVLLTENERPLPVTDQGGVLEEDTRPIADIVTDIPGTFQKSKFFGQSHWMNALEPYGALGDANTIVNPATDRVEVKKSTELYKTVKELKTMARILKTARMLLPAIAPEALGSLPCKAICDILVDGYLRTFEGALRVLHIPSFRKEYDDYWSGRAQSKPSVQLKIMLVCAIGVPFYTGVDQPRFRTSCAKWIQAAENWLAAPHAKSRLNMAGLQIQVLVLLAKQVCNVEGDHVWITAGSLLRTAMYLGLHRDPSYFGKINTFHAEMRRRLWATVLELEVQSSLDMGMPPLISVHDFDTNPPSNVDDEDLYEQEDSPLNIKPLEMCTDCSLQIAFAQSLPERLEIVRLINDIRFDLPYSKCLQLGKTLTELCDSKTRFFKEALKGGARITPFQIKFLDSLVRRFVLGLHRPYFVKAKENPYYHFSRKICLESSLAIIAPATAAVGEDWTLLTYRAVGFFKSLILYAMSTIYYELNTQIEEHQNAPAPTAPLISDSEDRVFVLPPQSHTLYDALVMAYHTSVQRILNGETNAKGAVFFACAVARVDALVAGTDPEAMVLQAAKRSIGEIREIMAEVYRQEHGESIDLSGSGVGNKDHGRGDGADDVTGQGVSTGTSADPNISLRGDMGRSASCGEGVDLDTGSDMQSYWPNDMMDFDSRFLEDPEWFFETSGWMGTGSNTIFGGI
ncbi:hypothetical protein C7974DRAFT_172295 [Boeremia exigua]|uniref:uncharacterized protein n=1 Tax=Boeremia exigua TaxID=749465 RepID=UPI001E8E0D46|nr:uncharacterized protein C7974DRAFT_172295 [Boeremia exigua]KAH6633473.1 hypothetical protein C7974DRAFT_172295 [Boeremia exigua]